MGRGPTQDCVERSKLLLGQRGIHLASTPRLHVSVFGPFCLVPPSPIEQSQQRRPHLPFNPIWGDTCGPLSGKTILGAPYPDGRYVLRDIGRRNYHGRRDVGVYIAGLHTTQMGPLAVKRRTELLRMAKLSRVD